MIFTLLYVPRAPTAEKVLFCPSLWSPESCLQNAPSSSGKTRHLSLTRLVACSRETTNCHASGLAASRVGGPRSHWPRPCARCLRQTSIRVGAHLCPRGTAGRSTTICIRPLAIRRSLVPGRPFCPAAASRQARLYIRPPGPVLDATLPSFHLVRFTCPPVAVC